MNAMSKNKVKQNLKQSKGCACETPLAEVFFFPGNGARKLVGGAVMNGARTCWRVVDEVNDRPVGNPKRRFD
jgi:hypothetical protein